MSKAAATSVPAGTIVAHYRVVRRIGSGGMGEVLLAQDTKLERSVAIKLMSAKLAEDPNQRKRFQTEAKAADRKSTRLNSSHRT